MYLALMHNEKISTLVYSIGILLNAHLFKMKIA